MRDFISGLKMSFGYFSALPVKLGEDDRFDKTQKLSWMLGLLPFVGLVIAFISVGLYYLISNWYFALLSAILYLMLSGFLHLEAVIDVIDAIYANLSGKDAYAIIKEPTVGAIGVLWGGSFLILEVGGIVFLLLHQRYSDVLMMSVVSRVGLLYVLYFFEFKSVFVSTLKESLDIRWLIFWGVVVILKCYMIAISLFVAYVVGRMLGFRNGDVLGFTLEATQICFIAITAITL